MIKGTIRRIKFMSDRIRIHTNPVGDANQARWGLKLAEEVFLAGIDKETGTGRILWYRLDPDIAAKIQGTEMDPYNDDLDQRDLRCWLWDHVVFDNKGSMIALHNHGVILLRRKGYELETDLFGRVRRRKEHKASRHNYL